MTPDESRPNPPSATASLTSAVAAALGLAATLLILLAWHTADAGRLALHVGDLALYQRCANRLFAGDVPYRDFPFEYPPAAAIACLVPRAFLGADASLLSYTSAFARTMIGLIAASVLVASRINAGFADDRRHVGADSLAFAPAVAAILLVPVVLFRLDAFPALVGTLALWATARRRPATAGGLLAVGTLAKLYPLAFVPPILLYHVANADRRSLRRVLLGGSVVGLAIVAPVTVLAPMWLRTFIAFHLSRGVQVESLPASLYLLAAQRGLVRIDLAINFGAFHAAAPGMSIVAKGMPFLVVAAIAAICLLTIRRMRRERDERGTADASTLMLACFCSLLAFVVFNKVLSPQYFVWTVPLLGLIRRRIAVTMLVACALTTAVFPVFYADLIDQDATAVVLLACRNATLLVALALGAAELMRAPGHAVAVR